MVLCYLVWSRARQGRPGLSSGLPTSLQTCGKQVKGLCLCCPVPMFLCLPLWTVGPSKVSLLSLLTRPVSASCTVMAVRAHFSTRPACTHTPPWPPGPVGSLPAEGSASVPPSQHCVR